MPNNDHQVATQRANQSNNDDELASQSVNQIEMDHQLASQEIYNSDLKLGWTVTQRTATGSKRSLVRSFFA